MTDVEHLMAAVRELRKMRDKVVCVEGLDNSDMAQLATALEVERRGPAFQFRAIMEEWEMKDIVRELY